MPPHTVAIRQKNPDFHLDVAFSLLEKGLYIAYNSYAVTVTIAFLFLYYKNSSHGTSVDYFLNLWSQSPRKLKFDIIHAILCTIICRKLNLKTFKKISNDYPKYLTKNKQRLSNDYQNLTSAN